MRFKISLRVRLAFWYSAIVGLSLAAFGVYTYLSVSNGLHASLDASLVKVAASLDYIIDQNQADAGKSKKSASEHKLQQTDKFALFRENEKKRFVGPLRPSLLQDDEAREDKDVVWSAVYEHILLDPKNYYIQIADTNNQIVWRSKNLQADSLPLLLDFPDPAHKDAMAGTSHSSKDSVIKQVFRAGKKKINDAIFKNVPVGGQELRLLVRRNNNSIVSVGYTVSDIESTMKQLFLILLIASPVILLISTIGGLVLSKLSLRPIEEIMRSADEITAKNLSMRLPEIPTKDEVGHLTKTLNRMIERLEDSFVQIRQFTSDASHELRTPLTILQGELELALHSEKSTEEYELVLLSALEEVARLTNVVETLLNLSRADSGQIKMTFARVNLSKLIQDIAEDASILGEIKGVSVDCNIQENIHIDCDQPRLHQAVLNIVDNAIKYTPEDGSISITLKNGSNTADIIVSDTGMGIPADQLPRIFDRFYRVDKARASTIQGSGLGLSIVKWIVDAHNGRIDVRSKPREGTTFTLKMPVENKSL